ncbi:hypothetical protein [Caballeronia sp. TF1N1]|uniref:hypothetical protein n=1 Tax=Caballeronia sp. TF1N1 TaxID=2878153 RepID=UPI001FD028EC|nr:hypothetical protein [Caballeronia sp. TF1N1]
MPEATTTVIGYEIGMKLTNFEAQTLKAMVQNPMVIGRYETPTEANLRKVIFEALAKAGVS